MTWHLLQISDVLDIEFGSALAERVRLLAWEPARSYFPEFRSEALAGSRDILDPPLHVRRFPLLRGFARFPWSALARTGASVTAHLARQTPDPEDSPLICTIPYFAPVAERWPGPVVYWLTDLMESYNGVKAATVHRLDERMCRAATLVCPNSKRLADYLMKHARCPESKIRILPNATRESNLLPVPPRGPSPVPSDLFDLPRPIAGIIGNLAENMNWLFLEELTESVPYMHWAFVGPTTMRIQDTHHREARERVMRLPQTRFVGSKPYGTLASYARSFDVAILPYRLCEPTYSGSSTRFYEHLAACRPMIATKGFEELLRKEPLLRLVDTAAEAAAILSELHVQGFDDGLNELRWNASQDGTWQARAATLVAALETRRSPELADIKWA